MSKRNVLIKRLQAVEALGQTKIIAVDKTGTLTKNEMLVKRIFVSKSLYEVKGSGYEPSGEILPVDKSFAYDQNAVALLAKGAALTSSARINWDEEKKLWQLAGDPTEAALAVFAKKAGQIKEDLENKEPKILEIPFDYTAKFHAVVNHSKNGQIVNVMGAAEQILEMSAFIFEAGTATKLDSEKKSALTQVIEKLASEGLRVVAYGYAENIKQEELNEQKSLTLVGFYGIADALRAEVGPAMLAVKQAGMKVVMITGDHKLTAKAIAKEAGIFLEGDEILSGEELNRLNAGELIKVLPKVSVFVRVTPEHKMQIIRAYKKLGLIIAMTGDGVNDAPSLVAADLGVGMGKIGTEVAKEASDLILLDDNFGSIVAAVEEGRGIYRTIQKALLFLFSTALAEVIIIGSSLFIGLATGMPLPLLAAQILWVNLVGDGILGVFLAYEPKEPNLLKGTFKRAGKYLIDLDAFKRMLPMSLIMAAGTIGIFWFNYKVDYYKALSLSFTLLAVYQWLNAWNCKSEYNSIFSRISFKNTAMTATTLLVFLLHLSLTERCGIFFA
jgi:Ca2+-transporting ATPase